MMFYSFLKRTKGSITVMVTLIMVPTIFFTGFLVDLARIKLYGNQAVMAADNYGEAVIAEYDALLKELYGLFAVTQDEEGMEAILALQAYMETSFDPSANVIERSHLAGAINPLRADTSGFMPYKSAQVTLSYEPIASSRLSDPKILSTQIGDFMRFRIVQQLADDGDMLLEALDQVQNTEDNAKVIRKKDEVDDAAGKALEEMKDYYEILKRLEHYPAYIKYINKSYQDAKKEFADIKNSDHYKVYKDYVDNKEEIEKARKKDEDERDEEDEKYIEMGDAYDSDSEAREKKLRDRFGQAVESYERSWEDAVVDFESFEGLADRLAKASVKVKNAIETLIEKRETLEASLNESGVSQELRSGIEEELAEIDRLIAGDFAGDNYVALADCIESNASVNSAYQQQAKAACDRMRTIQEEFLTPKKTSVSSYERELSLRSYEDFQNNPSFHNLYESLRKTFEDGSDGEREAKKQKKEAEKRQKEAEEETTTARDIPSAAAFRGIGDTRTGGGFSVSNLIGTASDYFACNHFGEAGNKLLLKFYTVAYDFGMFSSRTTNVRDDSVSGQSASEKAVSLTGVEMGRSVNYLYQAELEYLFGGHKSSKENLSAAKKHILAYRSVVNFTATYSVKEVNDAIKSIRRTCSAINPVLGIAAAAALRSGITALETASDWSQLSKGNAVVLIKRDLEDLTALDAIGALLGFESQSGVGSDKLALDYNQYLMIMVTFLTTSDQVIKRTADLITLNVNTVDQGIGENGELSGLTFRMDNAYTAVNAICTVHLDFAVMPDDFAGKVLEEDTYGSVAAFEKNKYQFTVTRGY